MSEVNGPILEIHRHERWGYFAAIPGHSDPEQHPVAFLKDIDDWGVRMVSQCLARIETASWSFKAADVVEVRDIINETKEDS